MDCKTLKINANKILLKYHLIYGLVITGQKSRYYNISIKILITC